MVNPFRSVSQADHDALAQRLAKVERERDDARREASGLRIELRKEVENAERLTALCGRAVASVDILKQTLIERQVGAKRDPSLVLVVNSLPDAPKRRLGFTPLKKRRREAAKREEASKVKRNALPTLTAELPEIPLTSFDAEAMRQVIAELSKENT